MLTTNPTTDEYRCPGEAAPISRSVHLGRLASFYPGCRTCPHCAETASLSPRQVKQLAEVRPRGIVPTLFHDEGVAGVYLNELSPGTVRGIAAAMGVCVRQADEHDARPRLVLGGDGRPLTATLVAAAGEGLRWAGCDVVDIGSSSSPCMAFAIDHLRADGGMLVGNPGQQPHVAGLKFWSAGARPLSAGGLLDEIRRVYRGGAERPTRVFGSLARFQADAVYLPGIAASYHALRPLRFVFDCSSAPLAGHLQGLTAALACQIIPRRNAPDRLGQQVLADKAHFGLRIGDDGETCEALDEQGREVPPERLFWLLIRQSLLDADSPGAIVLEEEASAELSAKIESLGAPVVRSATRRAAMDQAMREQHAIVGGGPSGRFWHRAGDLPLPDALATLTHLLVHLSRSDCPFSAALDAVGAGQSR